MPCFIAYQIIGSLNILITGERTFTAFPLRHLSFSFHALFTSLDAGAHDEGQDDFHP